MDINGKHVVIDLETLSTKSNAAIVSIGAIKIENLRKTDTFYINVDARQGKEVGLDIDPDTINWWSNQPKEQQLAWQKDPHLLEFAFKEFTDWYGNESIPIWGYGANFDVVILENAFKAIGHHIPWKFWDIYCLRTMMNVLDKRLPKANNHNALDDANAQASMLLEILKS